MKVYKIKVNGKSYKVEVEAIDEIASQDKPAAVEKKAEEEPKTPQKAAASSNTAGQQVTSPIQGSVVKVVAKVGDMVKKGTPLVIIEAMKLENEVVSPYDGEVAEILVSKGQSVASKEVIAIIK